MLFLLIYYIASIIFNPKRRQGIRYLNEIWKNMGIFRFLLLIFNIEVVIVFRGLKFPTLEFFFLNFINRC